VSIAQKAFEFDWLAFNADFRPLLVAALGSHDKAILLAFIDNHRDAIRDPYEGEPLNADWQTQLEDPDDVQALGDFALTRYYDPTADFGIGHTWLGLSEKLNPQERDALLGHPIGNGASLFDPGRMGSYFQSPELLIESIKVLSRARRPDLENYVACLGACQAKGKGIYVTF
jgi:hypothetical protein